MTRASFTGAFDESCFRIISRTPKFPEDGKNHCFVSEMIASKLGPFVDVDTSDQGSEQ